MRHNFLNLNDGKTEYLIIWSKQQISKTAIDYIVIWNSHIAPSSKARNLGIIFESDTSPKSQISTTLKCAYSQIRSIGKIRKYLTKDATIVHPLVTSRLDMCNSLLYGIPNNQLHRPKLVQNTAACLVILIDLHWLPVKQRIDYKILVLYFQSTPWIDSLIFVGSSLRIHYTVHLRTGLRSTSSITSSTKIS